MIPARFFLASLALTLGVASSFAQAPAKATVLFNVSASIGYDDNVYGIDTGRLAQIESPCASFGARLALDLAPGFLLAYSPTLTRYDNAGREDHDKHTLAMAWKQQAGDISWRTSTDFTAISGDRNGTDYGPGHGSAFSTAIPRERREQFQNKTDLSLRHDSSFGFVRTLGRLAYWDMQTAPVNGSNYVDRYDLQGGADLGRGFGEGRKTEMYLGYRRGYQSQDRDANPASPRHASNHYDRFVIGGETSPAATLRLGGEIGQTRHAFSDDPAVFAGPATEVDFFTDLTLTWDMSPKDTLELKTSRSRTVSTTGVNNLLLTTYQANWKHTLSKRWSTRIGFRAMDASYAPAYRHDAIYGVVVSLAYSFDAHWSATLAVNDDRGRELHPNVVGVAAENREFERKFVSVAVTWKK